MRLKAKVLWLQPEGKLSTIKKRIRLFHSHSHMTFGDVYTRSGAYTNRLWSSRSASVDTCPWTHERHGVPEPGREDGNFAAANVHTVATYALVKERSYALSRLHLPWNNAWLSRVTPAHFLKAVTLLLLSRITSAHFLKAYDATNVIRHHISPLSQGVWCYKYSTNSTQELQWNHGITQLSYWAFFDT